MSDSTREENERSSVIVMLLTLSSRLLGIVKAKVIASVYGSGPLSDVINFTYTIPNNFRKLFAEGAMSSAYVPVFSAQIDGKRQRDSNTLLNLLFTSQALIFALLFFVSAFLGEEIIAFFSDFDGEGVRLGGKLLPFFTLFLAFVSIGTIFSGILQCRGKFFAYSFAPLLFSLFVIFGVLLGHKRFSAMAMAYSVLAGGAAQCAFWYLSIRKLGYRIRPCLAFRQCDFPKVLKRWLLVVGSSLLLILSQQVSYYLASTLREGSVTALANATIFWQTPYGIFFTGAVAVLFPQMSLAWSRGEREKLRGEMSRGLSHLATFMIPSALIVFTLAPECVSSILQSGGFTLEVAMMTSGVVRFFLLGMLFVAWYGYVQRFCYSIGRYALVLRVTLFHAAADILLSLLFLRLGLGINALPLAGDVAYLLSFLLLLFSCRDIYPLRSFLSILPALGRLLLANLPALLASVIYKRLSPPWWASGSSLRNFLFTSLLGATLSLIVLASYSLFRVPFPSLKRGKGHRPR